MTHRISPNQISPTPISPTPISTGPFPFAQTSACRLVTLSAVAFSAAALLLAGCATGNGPASSASLNAATSISGNVHGGQQPVSGATIQLYAVGTSGYSSASTPLIKQTVLSDSGGGFNITGDYACPANSQVYLVATGGNPGMPPGTINPNLALMAAIGACSSLTPSTSIRIDERTTVAAVWSLSRFMSGYASVGSSATNTAGLTDAFSIVPELVTLGTGDSPGAAAPANATIPASEINTLGNVLAPCINSAGGTAGDNSLCGQLFSATTVSGSPAPQDTITAALNIARNPTLNTAQLFALSASNAPYQPSLATAPQNFLVAISYNGGGLNAPSSLAADAAGNIWAANTGNASVTELSSTGAALSSANGFTGGGLNHPSSIAVDESGTIWVANRTGNSVSLFSSAGAPLAASPLTGAGLNEPSSLAIDEDGTAWIANAGNNTLSSFSAAYVALSPAAGYIGGGLNQPAAIAINPH